MLLLTLVASMAATAAKATPEASPSTALVEAAESPAPAPAAPPAPLLQDDEEIDNKWHGSFTLGATIVTGNAEIMAADVAIDALKRSEIDRWLFRGWWNYSEQNTGTDDERTLNDRKAGLTGQYDYFLSDRMYALGTAGIDTDFRANINLRYTGGAGLGYQFIETEDVSLKADAALTYTYREFDLDTGGTDDEGYMGVRASYLYGHQLREDLRFDQIGEITPSIESDTLYAKLDSRLRLDLTGNLYAQVQWIVEYNEPVTGVSHADNRVILGVGWAF